MLDIDFIKNRYKDYFPEIKAGSSYCDRHACDDDVIIFSKDYNSCMILYRIHEYRMFVSVCNVALVKKEEDKIILYDLSGWYLTPSKTEKIWSTQIKPPY